MKKIHYAWIIMFACCLMMIDFGLQLSLVSVYLKAICESLGVSRVAYTLNTLFAGVGGIVSSLMASTLYKKLSIRKVLIIGGCITGICVFGFSFCTELWQFYLISPFYGFGGSLTATIPASILLSNWFRGKKGIATSIAFTGTSIGNLLFTQVGVRLLLAYGWQISYRTLAFVRPILILIAAALVAETPAQKRLLPYGVSTETGCAAPDGKLTETGGITRAAFLKTPVFYCLGLSSFAACLYIVGFQNHYQSYLTDTGMDPVKAANVVSILFIAQIIGKFFIGFILDRFGKIPSVIAMSAIYVVGGACALMIGSVPTAAYVCSVCVGLAACLATVFPTYFTSDIVGVREYAAIFGSIQVFAILGNNCNAAVTSALYDLFNGYTMAWVIYIALAILSCAAYVYSVRKGRGYSEM